MNIILLSGGSGKRLWPLSNNIRSKQFLQLFKNEDGTYESMVQRMYRMIKSVDVDSTVTIATSEKQVGIILSQLQDLVNISIEPCRRDTFPAIALATAYLHDRIGIGSDEAVVVCPVDPYVGEEYFRMLCKLYEKAIEGSSNLVLMGIEPTYPSAKYGYIIPKSTGEISGVISFREKPTEMIAEGLIKQGALWNSGVFAYKLSYVLELSRAILGMNSYDELYDNYDKLERISFDYAVVEKEKSINVLRFHGAWKDLGTWNTLTEAMSDEVSGKAVVAECANTHVINELQIPLIALGTQNLVIAATHDGILISDKHMSSYLKQYVADQRPMMEERVWGEYEVLDIRDSSGLNGRTCCENDQTLTKHLLIKSGKHISYQKHLHRTETWVVFEGNGEVVLDGTVSSVRRGDTIVIPLGMKHALKADTDLHIIEVQVGDLLTEDDIERFEWDWTAEERYERWIKNGLMEAELKCITRSGIEDAFGADLHFGTGGLRAIMGAGTNRMNTYTVAKASQGVANYLCGNYAKPSVIIAYDTRHKSAEFANIAASVFDKSGIMVRIFSEAVPTPLLSFAVRKLECTAGIVITASHNSKEYNGYKVYDCNGCQITDKAARLIQKEIDGVDLYSVNFNTDGAYENISTNLYRDYIKSVQDASYVYGNDRNLRIQYSPLNGTGLKFVLKALKDSGFDSVSVVPEQEQPNGDFVTCPYPNPESLEVMEYCVPYAENFHADIIIATDPDCDRIGVMCRDGDKYVRLNPNEVGVLLLDFICQKTMLRQRERQRNVYTPVVIKTVVTTSMADRIAKQYGLKTINTLTGFKYIGEQIEGLKTDELFVLGMEESCGYLSNTQIRDKDGVNAALLVCVMAQEYKNLGKTLYNRMQELYEKYGYYLNSQKSYKYSLSCKKAQIKLMLETFYTLLSTCEDMPINESIDYSTGIRNLPSTNMMEYKLFNGSRFLIRPSGTESKLKVYIEAVGDEMREAKEIERMINKHIEKIIAMIGNDLSMR